MNRFQLFALLSIFPLAPCSATSAALTGAHSTNERHSWDESSESEYGESGKRTNASEAEHEERNDRPDASIPVPVIDAGHKVRAGQSVVVRWKALGPDVEELELLLSIDGGWTFPLRISPELAGAENRYVWRVPNLSARDARIRIRARIDHREVSGFPSASFSIMRDAALPPERWLFHEGGWWGHHHESREARGFATRGRPASLSVTEPMPQTDSPVRTFLPSPAARFQPRSLTRPVGVPHVTGHSSHLASRFAPLRE
jgi:hypothetical protein